MMQKWTNYQGWMNGNDIPFWFVCFDEFPGLTFGKSLARGVYEMGVRIADTFFPRCRIAIIFLPSIPS